MNSIVYGETAKANIVIRPDQDPVLVTPERGWCFDLYFEETNGVGFRLQSIEEIYYNNEGKVHNQQIIKKFGKTFDNGYLSANRKYQKYLRINHAPWIGAIEYIFHGVDDNGNLVDVRIKLQLSQELQKVAEVEPSSYDTMVLRANTKFRLQVAPEVYWVPATTLGAPKLSKETLLSIAYNPELLRDQISTLYDVIQYIQVVKMKTVNGNLRTAGKAGISWEHPRPPEFSINKNESNCVGISAVANYLLVGDYEEVGFVEYGRIDGGHSFNYVKFQGKYYVFDLTAYKTDFLRVAVENGDRIVFRSSNRLANIHEVNCLQDYVDYFLEQTYQTKDIVFISYRGEAGMPVGSKKSGSKRTYCFPEDFDLEVLFDVPDDQITIERVKGPKRTAEYW